MPRLIRAAAALAAAALLAAPAAAAPPEWNARARAMLAEAVGFRTAPGHNRVLPLAERLAAQFRAAGFAAEDVRVVPHKDTAALVVRYRGDGSSGRKPILAIAHMDVVDALATDWARDPFVLREEDGYLYGRGAWDNKAGLVAIAQAFLRLKAEDFRPKRDLILMFSGDEETTGETTDLLAREHRALIDAEYALNADAGGGAYDEGGRLKPFELQVSEKVYATWTLTVRNRGGHSSGPRPDNAIYQLAAALTKLSQARFAPRINEATRAYFLAESRNVGLDSEIGQVMARFAQNPADGEAADRIEAYESYIGTTRTTCVATMLSAGHAENALPQTAVATVNCRIFPGESLEEVRAVIERAVADPEVEIRPVGEVVVGPPSPLRRDVMDAYVRALRRNYPDVQVLPTMAIGATDGNILRAHGIPTYGVDGMWVVTPVDDRAHGRDERIPIRGFEQNLDHWYWLLKDLGSPGGGRR